MANRKYVKKIDRFLEKYSATYFVYKKLNDYKRKLECNIFFDLKKVIWYERQWNSLLMKYEQIILHGIQLVSIGETVPRLFNLIEDINQENRKVLHVVLPTFFKQYTGGIYNRRLFDIFGKKIYFIRESNIDLWTYIFFFHMKDINMEQFDRYLSARLGAIDIDPGNLLLPFCRSEILEGESKLQRMGVNGEYICLHARESNVKLLDFSKKDEIDSRCRNCDINTFFKTSRYFHGLNMQSIRLGKYENQKCNEGTIIDYANRYYDEFMDFYLLSRCKFTISCDSGIAAICGYWGRPAIITNIVSICYGAESLGSTGYDMYLPKKFYSQKKHRYLNLYEMLDVMNACVIVTSNFTKRGIILEDNTEDEILEAAKELNDRMDHRWVESDEEKKHYEMYWEIMHKWEKNHSSVKARKMGGFKGYTMLFHRLSYTYLKNNLYLLDVDISLLP